MFEAETFFARHCRRDYTLQANRSLATTMLLGNILQQLCMCMTTEHEHVLLHRCDHTRSRRKFKRNAHVYTGLQ